MRRELPSNRIVGQDIRLGLRLGSRPGHLRSATTMHLGVPSAEAVELRARLVARWATWYQRPCSSHGERACAACRPALLVELATDRSAP